jgi:hypothetical protein
MENGPDVIGRRMLAWLCLLTWFWAAIPPAMAHHSSVGSTAGIPIPSLVHGQMTVMAENQSAILDLADQQPFQDETFLRLRNFIAIQSFRCLWGLVPGSVDDEASPFNECSHAYLSATRALLLYMPGMRGDQIRVRALIDQIELQMAINNAALVLCRYSDEPFNTADVISPRWNAIPQHRPSLLAALGVSVLSLGAAGAGLRLMRRPSRINRTPGQSH